MVSCKHLGDMVCIERIKISTCQCKCKSIVLDGELIVF